MFYNFDLNTVMFRGPVWFKAGYRFLHNLMGN